MLSKSVYEWHINQHAMSTCFYGICIITTIDATSTTSLDSLISKQSQISKEMKISKNIKHTWVLCHDSFDSFYFLGLNFVEFSRLLNEQFVIRVHRSRFFFQKIINAHIRLLESREKQVQALKFYVNGISIVWFKLAPFYYKRSRTCDKNQVFVPRLILVEQFFFMEHEFDMVPGKTVTIQFGIISSFFNLDCSQLCLLN